MTDYLGLEIEFEHIVEDDKTITAYIANGTRFLKVMRDGNRVKLCLVSMRCFLFSITAFIRTL